MRTIFFLTLSFSHFGYTLFLAPVEDEQKSLIDWQDLLCDITDLPKKLEALTQNVVAPDEGPKIQEIVNTLHEHEQRNLFRVVAWLNERDELCRNLETALNKNYDRLKRHGEASVLACGYGAWAILVNIFVGGAMQSFQIFCSDKACPNEMILLQNS